MHINRAYFGQFGAPGLQTREGQLQVQPLASGMPRPCWLAKGKSLVTFSGQTDTDRWLQKYILPCNLPGVREGAHSCSVHIWQCDRRILDCYDRTSRSYSFPPQRSWLQLTAMSLLVPSRSSYDDYQYGFRARKPCVLWICGRIPYWHSNWTLWVCLTVCMRDAGGQTYVPQIVCNVDGRCH